MSANPSAGNAGGGAMGVIKDIADGVVALVAICGVPAILFLAMDPLLAFVPVVSPGAASWWLTVAAIAIPMIPAISFIAGVRPAAGKAGWRIAGIIIIFILTVAANIFSLDWKAAVTAHQQQRLNDEKTRREQEEELSQEKLKKLVAEAVEEGIRNARSSGACTE